MMDNKYMDKYVTNVFDEMYYSGAPKWAGYKLKEDVSWNKTGCVRRGNENVIGMADEITEIFIEACLPKDVSNMSIDYYSEDKLSFTIIQENDNQVLVFGITYDLKKKGLVITSVYSNEKVSREKNLSLTYYNTNNTTREETIENIERIFYQELLPIYFEANETSSFSLDNLGDYTVQYWEG